MASMQGWYIDLPVSRERMTVPNRFQGSSLLGTTRIPDSSDVCAPGGSGYVMVIEPFTGGRLQQTFFDMNRDGLFNDADRSGGSDVVSGFALDGMPNSPIFIENVMYTSLDGGGAGNGTDRVDNDGDGLIDEADEQEDDKDDRATEGSSVDVSRMSWREITN